MRSINLFDYLISSILAGKLTKLRKAILKPLSLGMELRLVRKSLLTLLHFTSSLFDSHVVNTFSIPCPDVHRLDEKTDYSISCSV